MGDDNDGLFSNLLGKSYDYSEQIKTPKEMGMSARGSISALERDFRGLGSYAKLLLGGGGNAQKNPYAGLGNKYFLSTGATCKNIDEKDITYNKKVDRSIYINNVPSGAISLSMENNMDGTGGAVGLVPGILEKISQLNPTEIFKALDPGANKNCLPVELEVIDNNNVKRMERRYVTVDDIKDMPPCWFKSKKNPVTQETRVCESFTNMKQSIVDMPENTVCKVYYISIGLLLLYKFGRIIVRN